MIFGRMTRVVVMAALSSANANAGGAIEIPRSIDGTVGANATPATTTALLVGARWRYLNPDKEHSTWESMTLVFDASGNVDVATWGPLQHADRRRWHVVATGSAPTVDVGGVVYHVTPCTRAPRTTCLVGPRP